MIYSMTGYGRAEKSLNGKTIIAEVRSLNGKFIDVNVRLPYAFRDREMALRNKVSEQLGRGKIDVFISVEESAESPAAPINKDLAKKYFDELKQLAKEFDAGKKNLFEMALRMPGVTDGKKDSKSDEDNQLLDELFNLAMNELISFRSREGKELEKIFREQVAAILSLLDQVQPFEKERIETTRTRLDEQLKQGVQSEEYDRNRFEQELIYYLERMDFSEEKMRLRSHSDYFLKTLDDKEANGRKLSFISQEMGREINTLGSKAYHVGIQKIVVQMKDELEKIKEQLLNVL